METAISNAVQNLGQTISELSVSILRVISSYVVSLPSAVIKSIMTVVATFFIATDYQKIVKTVFSLLPEKWKKICMNIMQQTSRVIFIYIRSYAFIMLITFVELLVGLLLMKIPYAVFAAMAIAIFDCLPILGTGGILIPWAVIGNIPMAAGVLVLYLVITAIRNMIEPKLVGKQIGLHPLVTLMALFVGSKLFGILGMFLLPVGLSIVINMNKEKLEQRL